MRCFALEGHAASTYYNAVMAVALVYHLAALYACMIEQHAGMTA